MKRLFKTTITVLLFSVNVMAQNKDSSAAIKIGDQVWMAENLNVSKFKNGDPIPQAQSFEDWKKAGDAGKPAWCYYENKSLNANTYGRLYNWYALNDPRGLAPSGWHVATDVEWDALLDNAGGNEDAGGKIKSSSGWKEGNGDNESGFTALPGGSRNFIDNYNDGFLNLGLIASFWSATATGEYNAWAYTLRPESNRVSKSGSDKADGRSIRCVKD